MRHRDGCSCNRFVARFIGSRVRDGVDAWFFRKSDWVPDHIVLSKRCIKEPTLADTQQNYWILVIGAISAAISVPCNMEVIFLMS